jgi:hypothetical protein
MGFKEYQAKIYFREDFEMSNIYALEIRLVAESYGNFSQAQNS